MTPARTSRRSLVLPAAALALVVTAGLGWWLVRSPEPHDGAPPSAPPAVDAPRAGPANPAPGGDVPLEQPDPAAPLVTRASVPEPSGTDGRDRPPIELLVLRATDREPLESVAVFAFDPDQGERSLSPVSAFLEDGRLIRAERGVGLWRWPARADGETSVLLVPTDPELAVRRTSFVPDGVARTVLVSRAGRLTGQVVDAQGRALPASLRVVPLAAADDGLPVEPIGGLTDPQGRFDMRLMPEGEALLQALAIGDRRGRDPFSGPVAVLVHVAREASEPILAQARVLVVAGHTVDVLLSPGGHEVAWLAGRVRVDGRPAAGWAVRMTQPVQRIATTAADGTFALGEVPAGEVTLALEDLDAQASGELPFVRTLAVARGGPHHVEIELRPVALSGVVLDAATRRPLPGAPVRARPIASTPDALAAGPVVFADAGGAFQHANLPPGAYVVEVGALLGRGLGPWQGHAVTRLPPITLGEGERATGLVLALPARQSVRGLVIADGLVPADFPLLVAQSLDGPTRVTAVVQPASQRFAFEDLPPGRWRFVLSAGDDAPLFAPLEREIGPDPGDLVLAFERAPGDG